jgi:hypothetical protein
MFRTFYASLSCVIAVCFAVAGCGEATNPHLIPVSGTITMDGRPLVGASVTLVGDGATASEGGTGITDAAGKYEISHFRAGKGAVEGEYKVVINKMVLPDGSPIPMGTISAAELGIRDMVPPRYGNYSSTMLKASVRKDAPPLDFMISAR